MVDLFNDNELYRKVGKTHSSVTSLILSDRGSPYTSKGYDRLTRWHTLGIVSKNGLIMLQLRVSSDTLSRSQKYKTIEELVSTIDSHINFSIHQRILERNNGLTLLEMRIKAVAKARSYTKKRKGEPFLLIILP